MLRRCLSSLNRICGRPHWPRSQEVRELCKIAGVTWPEPEPRERSRDDSETDELTESSEEELEEDSDEECEEDCEG